jgi:hypothetical protein
MAGLCRVGLGVATCLGKGNGVAGERDRSWSGKELSDLPGAGFLSPAGQRQPRGQGPVPLPQGPLRAQAGRRCQSEHNPVGSGAQGGRRARITRKFRSKFAPAWPRPPPRGPRFAGDRADGAPRRPRRRPRRGPRPPADLDSPQDPRRLGRGVHAGRGGPGPADAPPRRRGVLPPRLTPTFRGPRGRQGRARGGARGSGVATERSRGLRARGRGPAGPRARGAAAVAARQAASAGDAAPAPRRAE